MPVFKVLSVLILVGEVAVLPDSGPLVPTAPLERTTDRVAIADPGHKKAVAVRRELMPDISAWLSVFVLAASSRGLALARAPVACFSGRMSISCDSLDQVRAQIDRLDRQIVALLAERGEYVRLAARFKKTSADVAAPARVQQVIAKVRTLASEAGAEPAVVERVYRAMIAAFIETEQAEHARLGG